MPLTLEFRNHFGNRRHYVVLQNASEVPGAKLQKRQFNHENGDQIDERNIDLSNEGEVVGFGADGDDLSIGLSLVCRGFIGSQEYLGGASPTWNTLINSGKLKEPSDCSSGCR